MDVFRGDITLQKIRDLFEKKYSEVSQQLSSAPSDINEDNDSSMRWCYQRIKDLLDYNTRDGKRMRGLAVVSSYLRIAGSAVNQEDLDVALALGWAIEIMQGSFLVADDIMDQSKTRRGKPCWYKKEGVGLQAVNDSMLLESCVFILIKKYCRSKLYYADLLDLFRETGTANPNTLQKSKEILTEMGCYFQIQDDFIDCFGDPAVTGKIGTDIEANKCTWLIVQALKKCSQEQKVILEANYGKSEPAKKEAVVRIYKELHLEEYFHQFEKDTYSKLKDSIMAMKELDVPPEVFMDLLNTIYLRKK